MLSSAEAVGGNKFRPNAQLTQKGMSHYKYNFRKCKTLNRLNELSVRAEAFRNEHSEVY